MSQEEKVRETLGLSYPGLFFCGLACDKEPYRTGVVFAQRRHSANYYVVYPGNTPENHTPTEACMIHSKQHWGCRIQDPGTRGKHQTKTKIHGVPAGAVGCRIQDPGTRGYQW